MTVMNDKNDVTKRRIDEVLSNTMITYKYIIA